MPYMTLPVHKHVFIKIWIWVNLHAFLMTALDRHEMLDSFSARFTTNSTDGSSGIQSCFFDGEVKYSGSQFTAWTAAGYVLHTTLESSCMCLHQCSSKECLKYNLYYPVSGCKVALSNAAMHTLVFTVNAIEGVLRQICSVHDRFPGTHF